MACAAVGWVWYTWVFTLPRNEYNPVSVWPWTGVTLGECYTVATTLGLCWPGRGLGTSLGVHFSIRLVSVSFV